ncbi:MAG TPA: hypothetical protein VI488_05525 [Candidatus Angelobacter sp.]
MGRFSSFAYIRSSNVVASMILGLLMCCQDARSQEAKTRKKVYHPPAPEVLEIGQKLPHGLCLAGGLMFSLDAPRGGGVESSAPIDAQACGVAAETTPGAWGNRIIEIITNLSPAKGELARFGTKDDISAGEALDDDTWSSPLPATRVKSSSVVLQVPISWTGTGNGIVGGLYGTYGDGDTGVYTARVEDCLSSSDHTKLKQVQDRDGKAIKCTTADGVLGRSGHWYDLSEPWSSTKYLTLVNDFTPGVPGLPKRTINDTLSIPVDLPVPVNSLRVEFELGLKDSHCPSENSYLFNTSSTKKKALCTDPTASDPYIKSYWGSITGQNSQGQTTVRAAGGPEFLVTRFAIQLPNITVLPAAFLQMKVLPYTIVYRPPGDKSQGVYTTTESYGTSLTTGQNTSIDNTTAFMESMDVKNTMKISALILSIEQSSDQSSSSTSATDNNATIGTGLVVSNSHSRVRGWTLGSGSGDPADPTILPAAEFVTPNTCTAANYAASGCKVMPGETFSQEPFWEDRIVVLLNPTAALWNFNASTTMQLLGAEDFDDISIKDLASCAQNTGRYGWTLANGSKLTPKECLDLLGLDPYYNAGQSLDPSKSGRGVLVGNGSYGADPRNPSSASVSTAFQDIFTYTSQQSTNASASYQASVTNVVGFSWSDGMTLSATHSFDGMDLGISDGTTVTQGDQNTTGTQMKVTYTASTAATSTTTTQIQGTFADDHDFDTPACQTNSAKCYTPHVNVYIDELFGSYMFSDLAAPPNPLTRELQPIPVKVPLPAALKPK